ncbi:DUF11 domain-containing protein [Streptomyces sp. SID7909]|uniref:DUF7927 domain-containing protein n=1 Tax=Streptomyces sp. SID7909 TaxID=2706092 RepID=UPI0013BD85D7|nr:DUF11 domain-containing protein [Streptomyces sp. SID7909]NEC06621.1 DUF11 domain-containing protein [Streptomyces sp. SID7909]
MRKYERLLHVPAVAATACAGTALGLLLTTASGVAQSAGPTSDAAPAASSSARALGESVLLDETFTGTSVADPGFVPLDTACLTGASAEPPAGQSQTGPCDDPDTQMTPPVPTPGQTPGWLQLTDHDYYRVGGMLYNRPLPGNGGLDVTFEQYQYGTGDAGADGIGFFLVDGSVDLTKAGANGGSLGYAQRNLEPGVDGGYLGVGLDAYGNFANDAELRGNGCPDGQKSPVTSGLPVPDTVTLRGPGQGDDGYCFLDSTIEADATQSSGFRSTLPGSLREKGTDPLPAKRTVHITVSPDTRPTVAVEIDFNDGAGFQPVLSTQMTADAPPTYKFGFSGSTGGSIDTHLIRALEASSVDELDQLNLVKTVAPPDNAATEPFEVGDTVHYQFLVTNTGTSELTDVHVEDPSVTDVTCPSTTLGPMGSATSSMVCEGTHVLTEADVVNDTFTNTATAQGTAGDNDVTSNESSASVPVDKLDQVLDITKTAAPTQAEPGDALTYTVTATNSGETTLSPAHLTDDLSGVLDDTSLTAGPTATTGTAQVNGETLDWSGELAPGASVTITYTVTVDDPDEGDAVLRNAVTSDTPGARCTTEGAPELPCTTEVPVTNPSPSPSPSPTDDCPTPTPSPSDSTSPSPKPTHTHTHGPGPSWTPGPHPTHDGGHHGGGGGHDGGGGMADTGSAATGAGIAAVLLLLAGIVTVRMKSRPRGRH